MTKLKKHYLNNTMFLRRVKRLKNDIVIVFAKKYIFNIKSIKHLLRFSTKNLNIILKHIKSSILQIKETHLTIIYRLFILDFYFCFNIAY